jgi:hypothetical protein
LLTGELFAADTAETCLIPCNSLPDVGIMLSAGMIIKSTPVAEYTTTVFAGIPRAMHIIYMRIHSTLLDKDLITVSTGENRNIRSFITALALVLLILPIPHRRVVNHHTLADKLIIGVQHCLFHLARID